MVVAVVHVEWIDDPQPRFFQHPGDRHADALRPRLRLSDLASMDVGTHEAWMRLVPAMAS